MSGFTSGGSAVLLLGSGGGGSSSGGLTYVALTADGTLSANTRATNTGATGEVIGTLDAAAAIGDQVVVEVTVAQSVRVKAPASTTITAPDGTTCAAAGYYRSVRVGSRFVVTKRTATNWVATDATGTWSKNSTSTAGFAYTPTAWTAYTPATPFTGGTATGYTAVGFYRQVGSTVEQTAEYRFTGAADGDYLSLVPALGTIDATVSATTNLIPIGTWLYVTAGGATSFGPAVINTTPSIIAVSNASGAALSYWQRAVTATPANTAVLDMRVTYPVAQ